MRKAFILTVLVMGGLVAGLLWLAAPIRASSAGISGHSGNPATNFGMSCNACHGGGSTPIVNLTGPGTVLAGESVIFTLSVQSAAPAQQTAAGLDVSATAGTLASLGGDTQVMDGEITQTSPKNNTAGSASFSFGWTAPMSAPQTVTLYAAGNSVNLDGVPGGDHHANTTLSVNVVDPSAVALTGLTTATPTTPTALAAAIILLSGVIGLSVSGRRRRARTLRTPPPRA